MTDEEEQDFVTEAQRIAQVVKLGTLFDETPSDDPSNWYVRVGTMIVLLATTQAVIHDDPKTVQYLIEQLFARIPEESMVLFTEVIAEHQDEMYVNETFEEMTKDLDEK